jgi:hypothetical protein
MDSQPIQEVTRRQDPPRRQVPTPPYSHDFDVQNYIKKFNAENDGTINLLDFSNYATKFNDFKENAISKKDMEIIQEFQKRKIDQRLHQLEKVPYSYSNPPNM